jgi:hypothetical protein
MKKYLLAVLALVLVVAPIIYSQTRRNRVVTITPQTHPPTQANGYDYEIDDLTGSRNCWFYYGQDEECETKFIRFPAYTGVAPLKEVRLHIRWHLSYSGKFENISPTHTWGGADPSNGGFNPLNGMPWGFNWYTWSWSNFESGAMAPLIALPSVTIDDCLYGEIAPFDGVLDYQGPSGKTVVVEWDQCLQPNYWTEGVSIIQHPFYLQHFTDSDGVVGLTFKSGAFAQIEHPLGDAGMPYEYFTYWDLRLDRIEYITY